MDGIIFLGALEGVFARGDVLSMISIMLRTKIESDIMMVCLSHEWQLGHYVSHILGHEAQQFEVCDQKMFRSNL